MKKLALVGSSLVLSSVLMAGFAIPALAEGVMDGYPPGYVYQPSMVVPELPAGLLLGVGLLGLGVYMAVKKHRKVATAK
jgi:hypothetical protein